MSESTHTTHSNSTVPGTAIDYERGILKAAKKVAVAMEQSKLLTSCKRLKLGTRGVELMLSKLIHEDIVAVGSEIANEYTDVKIYDTIMDRKLSLAERKLRKWKGKFHREKKTLAELVGGK